METEPSFHPAPPSVRSNMSVAKMMQQLKTREHEQNAEAEDRQSMVSL